MMPLFFKSEVMQGRAGAPRISLKNLDFSRHPEIRIAFVGSIFVAFKPFSMKAEHAGSSFKPVP
jgi:hypothetical protein